MTTQNMSTTNVENRTKSALNQRFEAISWALFLMMIGGIGLVPKETVPEGIWLIGVGMIMLGLNLARYLSDISMSRSTLFLGTLALLVGVASVFAIDLPIFSIALILLGLSALSKAFFEKSMP